jgi:hypothetical protein
LTARTTGRLVGLRRGLVVLAEPLGQHRCDVLVGTDLDLDRPAEHDFGCAHRRDIGRIGQHQPARAVGGSVREDQRFAQEAAGEFRRQRRRGNQLRQAGPGQPVEVRHLLGKVVGRQVARFPKVSQGLFAIPARGRIEF